MLIAELNCDIKNDVKEARYDLHDSHLCLYRQRKPRAFLAFCRESCADDNLR